MKTGHLVSVEGNWKVKYDDNGLQKFYDLCDESKKWLLNPNTKKIIKEELEVLFTFIVKGEYCQTKEQMIKNYFAKIKRIEHESF